MDIPKIEALAGQVAREELVDLVDLEVGAAGSRVAVRVFVDRKGGITLKECEAFSRKMSVLLDLEDPVEGPYVLEVSSPGLDRRLSRPAHFHAVRGRRVRAVLGEPVEGSRHVSGRLLASDDAGILVDRGDRTLRIPYGAIRKARLEVSDEELFGKGKKKP